MTTATRSKFATRCIEAAKTLCIESRSARFRFVTSVFPLGARVDSELTVQLRGWNLTQTELDVKTLSRQAVSSGSLVLRTARQTGISVRFPLQIDYWPEVIDQEPNNDRSTAQEISTRMTINGRIDRARRRRCLLDQRRVDDWSPRFMRGDWDRRSIRC